MKNGLIWSAIDKYTNVFVTLIISMVLARLLSPYEFGVVSTATVLLAFLAVFTDIGFGPAVIQRKDLTQDDLNNIFSFTLLLGLALGVFSFISSWFISNFYHNEDLTPVIQVLSVGLIFSSINIVPAALMAKNMRFKEMATRSIAFKVFFGILGVVSAYFGAGVYALVLPQILSSICTFFYNNHFYPVRYKFHLSFGSIKKVFSYSVYVFLTNFGNYLGRNLDKLIIGKTISQDALGYYDKSYRLMQMPLSYVSSVFSPVLQPVLSSLQNNKEEMAIKYTKIVSFIASLSFPIAVVMFFSAESIIVVLFGKVWIPAAAVFRIMAVAIPLTMISSPNGAIYMSCNATKEMFWLTIIGYPFFIASYTIAAFWGRSIEAIAWAWVFNELFGVCMSYFVLYVRVMKSSLVMVFKALLKPFVSALILASLYLAYGLFMPSDMNAIWDLIFKLCIGGIIIIIYLKITGQFDAISFIRQKILKKEI